MAGSAQILASDDLRRLLAYVQDTRYPTRNAVIVLLSFKAGLRACEIAGLDWAMVVDARGKIGDVLALHWSITKGERRRVVPLHPDLKASLRVHWRACGCPTDGPVVPSERGDHMTAKSIVNWFSGCFDALGMTGCSSHSGRRTFITQAARLLAKTGGSLRDVQELAGHAALSTTEAYIEGDRAIQRRLVSLI